MFIGLTPRTATQIRLWHIEGQNFDVRLRAPGYTQHLCLPMQHVPRQTLISAERAGISFAEQSFG
jgi:hypothetical protein